MKLVYTLFCSLLLTGVLPGFLDEIKSIFVSEYGGLELVGEAAGERPGALHCCGQSLAYGAFHLPYSGSGNCR